MTLRTGSRGFTLIEVMVAAAILAGGITFVYEALFNSLAAFDYYANSLSASIWMDEKIWQAQNELTNSGVFSGETAGEYLNNNRKVKWDLSYLAAGESGLYSIALRLTFRAGNKDMVLSRSAYALFVKKE